MGVFRSFVHGCVQVIVFTGVFRSFVHGCVQVTVFAGVQMGL